MARLRPHWLGLAVLEGVRDELVRARTRPVGVEVGIHPSPKSFRTKRTRPMCRAGADQAIRVAVIRLLEVIQPWGLATHRVRPIARLVVVMKVVCGSFCSQELVD